MRGITMNKSAKKPASKKIKKSPKHPAHKKLNKLQKQQDAHNLGIRIKTAREAAGYTKIIDFKNKHFPDVTRPLYYQWEVGIRHPNEKAVEKIAKICKVNPKWLKTGGDEPLKGIKLPKKELNARKALIGYCMIKEQLAQSRNTIAAVKTLHKRIYEFATIPTEETGAKKQIILAINVKLMQNILEELAKLYKSTKKSIDYAILAKYAAQIYSSIIEHEARPKEQLKQVKVVVGSYKRLIGTKQQLPRK
jgi:hypothetical protein